MSDILVASVSLEQHQKDIEQVFRRLNDFNLKVNFNKSIFM